MFFDGIKPALKNCCGCSACKQICPKDAISWTKTDDGFCIPEVNLAKCINCGLCEKVCPMVHSDMTLSSKIGEPYAAVNKNTDQLLSSSSGGIFSLIAEYILKNNGIVYGASFDENMQLKHIGIRRVENLYVLQGSKYLQSNNNDVYTDIRNELNKGIIVYYVGTGCQVAGLKLFLRKDYPNLFTSDILCHGVPPQMVFDSVIKYLEDKYKGKVIEYKFRDKSVWGWSCSSSCCVKKGNSIKYVGFDEIQDGYFNAFIKAENYREACYVCPFARDRRSGDITLGDFWGVERYVNIPDVGKGVSAIIINTEKGKKVVEDLSKSMLLIPSKLSDISEINKTLISPTPRPDSRDTFFEKFEKNPVDTITSYSRLTPKKHMVYLLKKNKFSSWIIKKIKATLRK